MHPDPLKRAEPSRASPVSPASGFRKKYSASLQPLKLARNRLAWHTCPLEIVRDLGGALVEAFQLEPVAVYLRSAGSETVQQVFAAPAGQSIALPKLSMAHPIVAHLAHTQTLFLERMSLSDKKTKSGVPQEARVALDRLGFELAGSLTGHEEWLGCVLLGPKANRAGYDSRERAYLGGLLRRTGATLLDLNRAAQAQLLGGLPPGLAHDLQNYLTPVSAFIQVAHESDPTSPVTEELRLLASRNLNSIQDLIDEALLMQQGRCIRFDRLSLPDLVRQAVDLTQPYWGSKGVRFEFDFVPGELLLLNKTLFIRLATNLIQNAVTASPPGGTVRFTLQELTHKATGRKHWQFQILDDGPGIPSGALQAIEEPVLDSSPGPVQPGLGLAICREIARLHRARFEVGSRKGQGTCVTISFPPTTTEPA